jgi:LysM repeat protein
MTDASDPEDTPRPLFPGLVSSEATPAGGARHRGERRRGAFGDGIRKTLPFVVASAMTMGLNLTGPVEPVSAAPKKPSQPKADLTTSMRSLVGAAARVASGGGSAAAASSYTVQAGDTVAAIAGRHGLSTASVLALNGLGWKSLIFPGQVLKLAPGARVAPATAQEGGRYTITRGDTVSRIAAKFGVPVDAVLSANGLGWSSIIYPGQTIAIPAVAAPAGPKIELVASTTPAAAPAATPAPAPTSSYTIAAGDTISAIAARFGVTTSAVLAANGLTASSIIYPGQKLIIPAAGGASSGGTSTGSAGSVTILTAEQETNARIIIQVGREQGVPDYGIIIALATAMQESSLRNINYGDRDSVGLFQQRTSTGWGTIDDIMNPYHSAFLFYQGRSGYTRGLLDISGWQSMALTVAAQKVQISAYPDHYAKWETSARAWFAALA